MLHEFLIRERASVLDLAKQKAVEWQNGRMVTPEIEIGWSLFYDELIELMQLGRPIEFSKGKALHASAAVDHGREYLKLGYTISEVVYSYGAICQAVTSAAASQGHEISSLEFQRLNLSLDTAIAEAVSAFDFDQVAQINRRESNRLGALAQDLRKCIEHVSIALEMIESGNVGIRGNTARVMHTNLARITKVVDTALAEIRLRVEPEVFPTPTRIFPVLSEIGVTARFEARSRNIELSMQGQHDLEATLDPHLLLSAMSNLVRNALQYSKPGTTVEVRASKQEDRLVLEVKDGCGGLGADQLTTLLEHAKMNGRQHFEQRTNHNGSQHTDHGGNHSAAAPRGIALTQLAVGTMGGTLSATNLPGTGCIFTIDLPLEPVFATIPA